MKKLVIAAGLAATVLLASAPAQAASCTTAWTSDSFVALRSGPGTQFARKKKLFFQSTVRIVGGAVGNWQRVKHGGTTGWVNTNLIDWGNCW
jgi:uncharacterized protein YraI